MIVHAKVASYFPKREILTLETVNAAALTQFTDLYASPGALSITGI